MTEKDIQENVALVRDSKDGKAIENLIGQFKGYMTKIALAFDAPHFEDAFQDATIGLWQAAARYNPETGNTFFTFAFNYIKGYVIRGMNGRRSVKVNSSHRISDLANDPKYLNLKNTVSLDVLSADAIRLAEHSEAFEADLVDSIAFGKVGERVDKLIERMNPRHAEEERELERRVLRLHLGRENGISYKPGEIAEMLGGAMSKEKVRSVCSEGRKALRKDAILQRLYAELK